MLSKLTSLLVVAQLVAGICYWPDGSVDTTGYECNTTAVAQGGHTSCCLHDDACYASGACFQDWSGVMYRRSCTDQTWKDPSCPQYCLQKDQLDVQVWLQNCNLQNKTTCCVMGRDLPSCCNDSSNLFTFKPGKLQAVINGDGTNRLGPYVATDGKAVMPPASATPTGSQPGLPTSSDSSATTTTADTAAATAADTIGDTGGLWNPIKNAVIAISVVLGSMVLALLASLAFVWRKLSQERRQRREGQKVLKRQENEIWPQITHHTAYQTGENGVAGWRSEMFAGEPGATVRELHASERTGELST